MIKRYFELLRPLRYLVLLVAVACISGCDFDDPIVTHPTTKIDPGLIGRWTWKDSDDTINVELIRADDTHYAGKSWPSREPEKIDPFIAWPSIIEGSTFLTVDVGKTESSRYLYVRLSKLTNKTIRYEQVDSKSAFGKDKNGTVADRLRRHLKDKDLFLEKKVFTKQL